VRQDQKALKEYRDHQAQKVLKVLRESKELMDQPHRESMVSKEVRARLEQLVLLDLMGRLVLLELLELLEQMELADKMENREL